MLITLGEASFIVAFLELESTTFGYTHSLMTLFIKTVPIVARTICLPQHSEHKQIHHHNCNYFDLFWNGFMCFLVAFGPLWNGKLLWIHLKIFGLTNYSVKRSMAIGAKCALTYTWPSKWHCNWGSSPSTIILYFLFGTQWSSFLID